MTSCFGKKIFTSHFLAIFLLVSLNCLGNFTFEKNDDYLFSDKQESMRQELKKEEYRKVDPNVN